MSLPKYKSDVMEYDEVEIFQKIELRIIFTIYILLLVAMYFYEYYIELSVLIAVLSL